MEREKAIKILEYIKSDYNHCAQEIALNMAIESLSAEPCEDAVSRRAAIETARSNIHYGLDKEYEYSRELLEKTMAEINSLPSVTPESIECEDAVSREQILNKYADWFGYGYADNWFYKQIKSLLSVTPTRKKGRWMAIENEEFEIVGYYCSNCDLPLETEEKTKYCPNCGAKMELLEKQGCKVAESER